MRESYFLKSLLVLIFLFLFAIKSNAQLKITFPSKDNVSVTADWYPVSLGMPIILLCHQARFSRGEYKETALKLNKFGFNCLAIDQRFGAEANGIVNETAAEAKRLNKSQTNLDAEQDILAALDYLYDKYKKSVIILGSSYSASLALKVGKENNHVLGVVAFSPGEYFEPKNFIAEHINGLSKPVFITSSKEEADAVTDLVKDVVSLIKVQYIPKSKGDHGSKVLWSSSPFHEEYWIALMSFLDKMKKIEALGAK
jgi:dienelactone hydrolase